VRIDEALPGRAPRCLRADRDVPAKRARELDVERIRMVATSATRDAANRDVFVAMVRTALGVEPEVISGAEEAALSIGNVIQITNREIAGTQQVEHHAGIQISRACAHHESASWGHAHARIDGDAVQKRGDARAISEMSHDSARLKLPTVPQGLRHVLEGESMETVAHDPGSRKSSR